MSLFPLYMIFKSLAASNRGELTALARRAPLVFYCKKRFHKVAACTQGDFQRQTIFFYIEAWVEYIRVGWISSGYVERHQLKPWLTVCQMKTQPSLMFGRVKNFQKLTFWFWFTLAPESGGKLGDRGESFCSSISAKSAPCHNSLHRESIKKGKVFPVRDSHTGWKLVRVNFARLWNHPASNGDSNL